MPSTTRQLKTVLVVFAILAIGTIVGYHYVRAGNIAMAEGRRTFDLGKFDVAEEAFERATRFDPNNAEAWYWLGAARKCQGKIEAAADALVKATKLNGQDVNWWFECAQLLQWSRRFAEAEQAWKRTLQLLAPDDPRRREVQVNLARAIAFQGDVDRAVAMFEKMLAARNDPELRFVLAELLMWTGRLEESANQYRIALQQQQQSETQP